MNEIIAMHGWACDQNLWSNWIEIFKSNDWRWQSAERGYGEIDPYTPTWNSESKHNSFKRVVICHSFGSHLINQKILDLATHVILINSFSRFIPCSKEKRSVTMALKGMMKAINTPKEISMLKKFHRKAYEPNFIDIKSISSDLIYLSESGRLKLINDLKLLIKSDELPAGLNSNAKVLVINSEEDNILTIQTKNKLIEDLKLYLHSIPKIINLKMEGHYIKEVKNIKKIKQWLESNHA